MAQLWQRMQLPGEGQTASQAPQCRQPLGLLTRSAQGAALEKDVGPEPRPVLHGEFLDGKDDALRIGR